MDINSHPCFNAEKRHTTGRIHLPVAPQCNIQCNFCNRKFSCVNESRPGVTSTVLSPQQGLTYLNTALAKFGNIAVAGIAGPGDPFANGEETMQTLRLVREKHSDILLCVATNGLELPEYVVELADLNVSHVTVTVNAIDPKIGSEIYSWVRFNKKVYRGEDGATLLHSRQVEGIRLLKENNITVKINMVIVPGVNDKHAEAVAREMSELGADVLNCIPLYDVPGTPFGNIKSPQPEEMADIRNKASVYMKQMSHCSRCRADAAGLLGEMNDSLNGEMLASAKRPRLTDERPYIAVASHEGIFVNQHLGEAPLLWIYGEKNGVAGLVDKRKTPSAGSGVNRWEEMAALLHDCAVILTSGSGKSPQTILETQGINLITMEGLISEGVDNIFAGKDIPTVLIKRGGMCGLGKSCSGTGNGCG